MDVPVEFIDAVRALPLRDSRPICAWCDRGKLDVIKQWSNSCDGIVGVTVSRLLAVALGQLTGLVAKCLASTAICGFSVASSVGSIDMK